LAGTIKFAGHRPQESA